MPNVLRFIVRVHKIPCQDSKFVSVDSADKNFEQQPEVA